MERISTRQMILLGAFYMIDAMLVMVPAQMATVARGDTWLAFLPSTGVILFATWLLSRVSGRFPGQDLFEALAQRFPVTGRVVVAGYLLFYLYILTRDTRSMMDFTNVTLLPSTPQLVLALLLGMTTVIIAQGGVEILARMFEAFAPVLAAAVYLMPLLLFKDVQSEYLQPFLEQGLRQPLAATWYALPYIGEVLVVPLIATGQTYRFRTGTYALLLGVSLMFVLTFLSQTVLGYPIMSRSMYPTYELVRQIRVTDFLDRLDLVYVGLYLPTMCTKLAVSLHVICHGLKRILPGLSVRVVVVPLGFFTTVCAYWFFTNSADVARLNRVWPVFALVYQVVLPVLFFLVLRPRKGAKESPASA